MNRQKHPAPELDSPEYAIGQWFDSAEAAALNLPGLHDVLMNVLERIDRLEALAARLLERLKATQAALDALLAGVL